MNNRLPYSIELLNKFDNLNITQQKILAFMLSNANINVEKKDCVVSAGFLQKYVEKSISTVRRNINILSKATIDISSSAKGSVKVPIFSSFSLNDGIYTYQFNSLFLEYILSLKTEKRFYAVSLGTIRLINSKSGLILFNIWSANKSSNATTYFMASVKHWGIILGLRNKKKEIIVQAISQGIKELERVFGHRYYFLTFTPHLEKNQGGKWKKEGDKYGIVIFGDNTTLTPIPNQKDDTGHKKKDIHFLKDEHYQLNVDEIDDPFWLEKNTGIYSYFDDHKDDR